MTGDRAVVAAVRPARPAGTARRGSSCWGGGSRSPRGSRQGLTACVVKIGDAAGPAGCVVPYRTLHRFCVRVLRVRPQETTVRVADGEPGVECQIDFGQMGWLHDPDDGRRRRCTR